MSTLRRLIIEVHRRSLWQVLTIYLVGSWVGYEVILGLVDGIGLPAWVPSFAVVLFIIGLPVVMATAFVQEGGPERRRAAPPPALEGLQSPLDLVEAGPAGHAGGEAAAPAAAAGGPLRRHLTWSRSIAAGIAAFVLLGASTGAYMGLRSAGIGPAGSLIAKGQIEEGSWLLVADFENRTADSTLAGVVSLALRTDLSQSPVLRIPSARQVADGLERMQRDPDSTLDPGTAIELAQRNGLPAVLVGELSAAGGRYLLSARMLETASGIELAAFQEIARDSTEILDALDGLAKQIRAKVGESLRSVTRSPRLAYVTTSSLDALREYTHGLRLHNVQGDNLRAAALYERAIALDSTFAMAYRRLATALINAGVDRSRQVEAARKAYELRDRLSEDERYAAETTYHFGVTGDVDRAIEIYQEQLERHPDRRGPVNNLMVLLNHRRRYAEAESLFYASYGSLDGTAPITRVNLVESLFATGDPYGSARLDSIVALSPDHPGTRLQVARGVAATGRFAEADSTAEYALDRFPGNADVRHQALTLLAATAMARGQLSRARGHLSEARRHARRQGWAARELEIALSEALMDLLLSGDTARALRQKEEALREYPLEAIDPLDRPYPLLIELDARVGRVVEAARLLDEYRTAAPAHSLGLSRSEAPLAEGRVAALRGENARAVELLRTANEDAPSPQHALPDLGRAYEALEHPDSAIATYKRYLEERYVDRVSYDRFYLIEVLTRLGALYEARGELREAAEAYARVADLWREADPPLRERGRAAGRRAAELLALSGG